MGAKRSPRRRDFPANLYQQPNGYFYYRDTVKKKNFGLGRDKTHAFAEARAANRAIAGLTKSSLVAKVLGIEEHTFETWLDRYLPLWKEMERPADGTYAGAERFIRRLKQADFASMHMKDITTKHIADYLDALLKESTPSVVVNLRARLQDVFRLAENKGVIDTGRNPVIATRAPEYVVKRERLSLEQFLAIREHVPKWMQNAMNLALMTGQRREDITKFKFADYRDGYLFIVQGKTGAKLQQEGKIRLEAVGMSIEDAIKACRDRIATQYMIHQVKRGRGVVVGDPMQPGSLTAAFVRGRGAAGITAQEGKNPPSFHEIRSLAERLYRKEYGQEFSQAIMGHKHAKMTAEYSDMRGSGWQVVAVDTKGTI